MNNTTIHVGLDVHKKTTAVAVSQSPGRARFIGMIDSNPRALLKVLGKLGDAREMSVVYEADAGGGCLELPFPGSHQSGDPGSPGRPAAGGTRDCLAGPDTIEPALPGAQGPTGCAQQDLRGGGSGTDRFRVVDRPTG